MTVELPFVDAHAIDVGAPRERVWPEVGAAMRGFASVPGTALLARVLDARERGGLGTFPQPGTAAGGFRVTEHDEPRRLVLSGRHRFARYRLSFLLDAVIGTRGHVVVVRRMLAGIRRRAEGRG